jgi:hypothetical protein
MVAVFRGWSRSMVSGLARSAVVGQLHELAGQLRQAPAGPRTDRPFLAGAELAKIAGSMSFDAGLQGVAQRYYVMAVQMAKAAGSDMLAAVALAALARQLFDLLEPDDGLGARYRDLARYDPAQASRAVGYIGQALVLRDASRQRNRVFDLIGLARVHLITGAPEQAAALIGQAMLFDRAEVRSPGRLPHSVDAEAMRACMSAAIRIFTAGS